MGGTVSNVKSWLVNLLLFVFVSAATTSGMYAYLAKMGDKTVHLEKKQWRPADPEERGFNLTALNRALHYVEDRLPTARSLIVLRNGETVVEKYYSRGGPEARIYLHSMNLVILQLLVGIAVDQGFLQDTRQPVAGFFPERFTGIRNASIDAVTIDSLLSSRVPMIWGDGGAEYWELFYAPDRVRASVHTLTRPLNPKNSARNFAAAYLLVKVIENVTSMRIKDFADQYLFAPLGITGDPTNNEAGVLFEMFVGFRMKALDLTKIAYLISAHGLWERRRIVSKIWLERMAGRGGVGPTAEPPGGQWIGVTVAGFRGMQVWGEGGQTALIIPELGLVVVTTSASRFAIPRESGRARLLELLVSAVADAGIGLDRKAPRHESANYVLSTTVPEGIIAFFESYSAAIADKNMRRILAHYAKGYERDGYSYHSVPAYWRKMFSGGSAKLQSVQIDKIRIEKNRAYLRGKLKYDYMNMMEGAVGWYPLENMIKLKGRWKWLGRPAQTALLDRDEYFDVEVGRDIQDFLADCTKPLGGEFQFGAANCFLDANTGKALMRRLKTDRIRFFVRRWGSIRVHLTGMKKTGDSYLVKGYLADSELGALFLPLGLAITKSAGRWKWSVSSDPRPQLGKPAT